MIVHLFPYSFFVNYYVDFISRNYDSNDHKIVIYRKEDYAREEISNSIVYYYKGKKDTLKLNKLFNKADRIVIHSLGIELEMLMLLYINKSIRKKVVWIIWGSDLYWKRDRKRDAISNIIEYIRERIIADFKYIGCLVTGDYYLATKWYKTNARMIRINYAEKGEKAFIDSLNTNNAKNDEIIRIIVGNCGTPSNGHKEICELLSKWKERNIHIYLPLSYGDSDYIDEIKKEYLTTFEDKVSVIENMMTLEDYLVMLSDIDIAIFNNDRQQALGNIFALMYMGKKVCLREGTSMWDELVNIQGARLYSCKDISNDSFWDEWPNEYDIENNKDVTNRMHYSEEILMEGWNKVFAE